MHYHPTSTVVVHYRGTLIDGTEFDSSYSRGEPATFSLNGIIPGWGEALQLMHAGDKWSVVIPPELAYGGRGAGPQIGPNETLVLKIELIENQVKATKLDAIKPLGITLGLFLRLSISTRAYDVQVQFIAASG